MPRLSSSRRTAEQGLLSSPGLVRPPWPALSFSLLLLLQLPPTGRETLTWKKIEVMSFLVYFPLASGSGKELPSLCVCVGGGGRLMWVYVPAAPLPATPRPLWPRATSPIS